MNFMKTTILRAIPSALLLAFAGLASASGFQAMGQNASGLGVSYAGSAAVADNASTLYYNPAGMTLIPGVQASIGWVGEVQNTDFRNRGSAVGGALTLSGGDGGNGGDWNSLPNAYLSWQLAPQWFVGLGISRPYAQASDYDSDWVGRYHAVRSDIRSLNINPSLAWKISDRVSVGFGLNYQKLDLKFSNVNAANVLSTVHADDHAWGWNAGALFTLSSAMRVGVAYRSGVDYRLDGDRRLNLDTPGTFTLSVWQRVSDRWEAMGDLSYTHWNRFDRLGLTSTETYNFQNSWRFAWGAAYKASEAWKFKFGLAYERSPVRDSSRGARFSEGNRVWLSLGGQWRPSAVATLDVGYAYIYHKDGRVSSVQDFGGGNTATLVGRYSNSGHVLGVQYSHGF